MREFKFRVFSYEGNTMLEWEQLKEAPDLAEFIRHPEECAYYSNLMQYTGLHDKDGREIYEGDIVDLAGLMKGVISFRDGCFGVEWGKNGEQMRGEKFERFKSHGALKLLKIIGDIYRNPELLAEETK